jgi:hypothetical protein
MTLVLAVTTAVAALAAVTLGWVARNRGGALRRAEERAREVADRLSEASRANGVADQERRSAEVRATAAEARLRTAEQRAGEAERRAGEAENRVGEFMRRAEESQREAEVLRLADAQNHRPDPGLSQASWELERLRVEREWLDVVGPDVPLPIPWDGSLSAVVATELSVIREVMGTPSEISVTGTRPLPPDQAAATARVAVEMLRTLARSGEEMDVVLAPGVLTVTQPVAPGDHPPDLSSLAAVAAGAGLEVVVEVSDSVSMVRLSIP